MANISGDDNANTISAFDDWNRLSEVNLFFGLGGDDTLTGGFIKDYLNGDAGDDIISGEDGADTISGGVGNDEVRGGTGDDEVYGEAGADAISGGAGDDTIFGDGVSLGGDDGDMLRGDQGDDFLFDGGGDARLSGGEGDDEIRAAGGTGATYVSLGAGDDRFTALAQCFEIAVYDTDNGFGGGNGGDDAIDVNAMKATIDSGAGDDLVVASLASETMSSLIVSGTGDDVIAISGGGRATIRGGAGEDLLMFDRFGAVSINLFTDEHGRAAAGYSITGIENLQGTQFDDALVGDFNRNVLIGSAGDDRLEGGGGPDLLCGFFGPEGYQGGVVVIDDEAPHDRVVYAASLDGVQVNLAAGIGRRGDAEGDRLYDIDDVSGSAFADQISGTSGANTVAAGGGADAVNGKEGDDNLNGGAGDDRIVGGLGADRIGLGTGADVLDYDALAESSNAARDVILDFARGQDEVDLAGVDANSATDGNQAFTWIGAGAFTGVAGQLHVRTVSGVLYLEGDVNGDRATDLSIRFDAIASLSSQDIVL